MARWTEAQQAVWEAKRRNLAERMGDVGSEDGLDWLTAGALGALMGVGHEALLHILTSFSHWQSEGSVDAGQSMAEAGEFLKEYRAQLKRQGVANV